MKTRHQSLPQILRNTTEKLPLWLLLGSSFVGYFIIALWFPLLPFYNQIPLLDIRSFTPSMLSGIAYGVLLCVLFAFFMLAYRKISQAALSYRLASILGISILFSLPLLLTYPVNANDIYRYVIRGRVMSEYGNNPFSVPPSDQPEDPFLPYAGEWAAETSPYGPVWELMASKITDITADDLLLGLLSFKILSLAAFIATTIIFWYLFMPHEGGDALVLSQLDRDKSSAYTILWAWNPALLLIFIVDGHNDVLMIFWLLLGLLVIYKGYAIPGFLIMILGALVKPIGILALPLIFISLLRQKQSVLARVLFVMTVVAASFLISILFFMPFGSPLVLVQRLMREAGAGASFSFAALALLFAQASGLPLTAALISNLSSLFLGLFALFAMWLSWLTWRGRSAVRGTADIFLGYLIQALNFRIWYAAWPFPWLLLDGANRSENRSSNYRLHYGLWFLLTTQLSVLVYGHIRIHFLEDNMFFAHLLGVSFTFLVPLFLAWVTCEKDENPNAVQES